jgi:tripartite motif-containing protein 71
MKPWLAALSVTFSLVTQHVSEIGPPHRARATTPTASVEAVYQGSIGGGPLRGHFNQPRGIVVSRTGKVFVADTCYSRVQVFDAEGAFLYMWGTRGDGPGQFGRASAIALDTASNVYVADDVNHRIQVFAEDGTFIRMWGSLGSGEGFLRRPGGLALDSAGNVYVADTYNYRIQVFTSDGRFLRSWGSKGKGEGEFLHPKFPGGDGPGPMGIVVDHQDRVYVTDPWNFRVQVFTSSGAFLREWGRLASPGGAFNTPAAIALGRRGGYLNTPAGIAIDGSGDVFVVNEGNMTTHGAFCVQMFTAHGEFLARWGSDGYGPGQFDHPAGVAVDAEGNFFVADTGNNRIQKFSSDGVFLKQWGSIGDGLLRLPSGVALDRDGNLIVADTANKRVQKFSATGAFIRKWGTTRAEPSGQQPFTSPDTIAVDGAGRIYVVDGIEDSTQVFTGDGTFLGMWRGYDGKHDQVGVNLVIDSADRFYVVRDKRVLRLNSGGGVLNSWKAKPQDMTVDPDGNLYVVEWDRQSRFKPDKDLTRVRVLAPSGREIAKWFSTRGPGRRLAQFRDIAVDSLGRVFVVDVRNHRVEVFDKTGGLLGQWGSYGFGDGQFDCPTDIAVDAAGTVYVSDFGNNRVQVFKIVELR